MIRPSHAAACAVVLAWLHACTYAWPTGAGMESDAGDAAIDHVKPGDGSPGPDADAGPSDADADALRFDAQDGDSNCAKLLEDIKSTKSGARQCFSPGVACGYSQNDECGCKVWVYGAAPGWPPSANFQNAVSAYASARCSTTHCSACDASAASFCAVDDGGAFYHCPP